MLLIESGSRTLLERLIPTIYEGYGQDTVIHVVTCYSGGPEALHPDTSRIFNVNEYGGAAGRRRLLADLRNHGYTVAGMICSGQPIMMKWKWWLAARLPLKFFILNENGDYFWFDRGHKRLIAKFILYRAGLSGASALPTLVRLAFFPFTLLYLILFAGWAHLKRRIRLAFSRS